MRQRYNQQKTKKKPTEDGATCGLAGVAHDDEAEDDAAGGGEVEEEEPVSIDAVLEEAEGCNLPKVIWPCDVKADGLEWASQPDGNEEVEAEAEEEAEAAAAKGVRDGGARRDALVKPAPPSAALDEELDALAAAADVLFISSEEEDVERAILGLDRAPTPESLVVSSRFFSSCFFFSRNSCSLDGGRSKSALGGCGFSFKNVRYLQTILIPNLACERPRKGLPSSSVLPTRPGPHTIAGRREKESKSTTI